MSKFNSVVINLAQNFDAAEKAQGRANIDAAGITSAFDASGNLVASGDITFDPDKIYVGGTEVLGLVQSDWNESDSASLAYISNKPTIPAAQVQSDWTQTSASQPDYIKNKPTVPHIYQNYGILYSTEAQIMDVDMLASKRVKFTTAQGVESYPGFFVPLIDEDYDEGKALVAGPDGYPVWGNYSEADWYQSYRLSEGSLLSTEKLMSKSFTDSVNATEIWGTVSFDVKTPGYYALCPGGVDTQFNSHYSEQCVNMGNLTSGHYSESFLFQADNAGDIQYLVVKGQSGKTASDVDIRGIQYAIKKNAE